MIQGVVEQRPAREVNDVLCQGFDTYKQGGVLGVSLENFFQNITAGQKGGSGFALHHTVQVTAQEFEHRLEIDHRHIQDVALVAIDRDHRVVQDMAQLFDQPDELRVTDHDPQRALVKGCKSEVHDLSLV